MFLVFAFLVQIPSVTSRKYTYGKTVKDCNSMEFLIKPLLRFSFLILFLLCFVTGQATSSALFYCQIGQSSKKLLEDKFRFQIKGNEIHFLPLGFFNPGEIFYINENGLFFLARAGRVGATSMGEIEFYPGNSFSGREGLFSYSDSSLTFQADCSRF